MQVINLQGIKNPKVLPTGFEPMTYGLEGRCSIQLSYGSICGAKVQNSWKIPDGISQASLIQFTSPFLRRISISFSGRDSKEYFLSFNRMVPSLRITRTRSPGK